MPLTRAEKNDLRDYVLARACEEYRQGRPCIQRKPATAMIGTLHAGCDEVRRMLLLVNRA
jgi:hypothetical protein